MHRNRSLALALACALTAPLSAGHAASPTPAHQPSALVLPSPLDDIINTIRLPAPSEVPDLVRRLGKALGKALGLEFAAKVTVCALAAETLPEFRRCLRRLLEVELPKL